MGIQRRLHITDYDTSSFSLPQNSAPQTPPGDFSTSQEDAHIPSRANMATYPIPGSYDLPGPPYVTCLSFLVSPLLLPPRNPSQETWTHSCKAEDGTHSTAFPCGSCVIEESLTPHFESLFVTWALRGHNLSLGNIGSK